MTTDLRPDIARVLEASITGLKALEHQVELVKADLASLCLHIGHPEAARIAAAPIRSLLASPSAPATAIAYAPYGSLPAAAQPALLNGHASPGHMATAPFGATAAPWGPSPFGASAWTPPGLPTFGALIGFAPAPSPGFGAPVALAPHAYPFQ